MLSFPNCKYIITFFCFPSIFQAFTCQMLKDTVACGELWSQCHTRKEIRSMKDMHINARVQQFKGNDIDVKVCDVVKEYIRSGRAEQKSEVTKCSFAEVIKNILYYFSVTTDNI